MRRLLTLALSAVALAAFCSTAFAADDDTKLKVKEGDKFPALELQATTPGKAGTPQTVKLPEGTKGKTVVLFFYPKAMTGGCTKECKAFRDDLSKFSPIDTIVYGISTDMLDAQDEFTKKESLTFPLLADPEQKVTKSLGVVSPKNAKVSQRVTFIIDKDGVIRKIYTDVKPEEHAAEVRAYIEKELAPKK